jgi:segregation and condensation protein B
MARPPLRMPPRRSAPRIDGKKGPLASASIDELVSALGGDAGEEADEAGEGASVAEASAAEVSAAEVSAAEASAAEASAAEASASEVSASEVSVAREEERGRVGVVEALSEGGELLASVGVDEEEDDAADRRAAAAAAGVTLLSEIPVDPEDDLRDVEGEASLRLVSIVESLLFAASKPLSVADLRRLLQETSKQQIQLALKHLMVPAPGRGVVVAQVAGGFTMRTHHENAVWVQRLLQAKPSRLSRSQLETLAIAAYRQPVTRPEIDAIRGVDSGAVLKALLERELLQIVGKKDEPGRPLLYGTTLRFLEFFNLRSLRDLPTLRDFRELSEESKATLRSRFGEDEALGQEVIAFAEEAPGSAPEEEAHEDVASAEEAPEGAASAVAPVIAPEEEAPGAGEPGGDAEEVSEESGVAARSGQDADEEGEEEEAVVVVGEEVDEERG